MTRRIDRFLRILFWVAPPCALTVLYWNGFHSWFQKDDFGWLGLPLEWRGGTPWHELLFRPMAQGTVRPWSERLFFLGLGSAFGLNPAPFHAVVFAAMSAALALLQWLTLRATRHWQTALAAPLVWLCSVGLASPLSWLSTWNQVLCALVLLSALACLEKALETGRRRWWAAQVVVFLLGFGVLELNVVYPALALGWMWLAHGKSAQREWKKVLPLFVVSGAYLAFHLIWVPKAGGVYARHWDLSMGKTLAGYVEKALAGGMTPRFLHMPPPVWIYAAWALAAAVAALTVRAWRRGDRVPAFGVLWFVALLGPVLPLRDHAETYYLGAAAVGVGITLAGFLASAAGDTPVWRWLAAGTVAVHALFSIPLNLELTARHREHGEMARVLVEGLERAQQIRPDSTVFLSGVNHDLYLATMAHEAQRLVGVKRAYILPGEDAVLAGFTSGRDFTSDVAPETLVSRALAWGDGQVYRVEPTVLRNITQSYWIKMPKSWIGTHPRMLDAGQPAFSRDLGAGWHQLEGTWRWMGKSAVAYLSDTGPGEWGLYLAGNCPSHPGPPARVGLKVWVNDNALEEVEICTESPSFEVTLSLDGVPRSESLEVRMEVSRTWRPAGDDRDLGLAFGQIGIRAK